MRIPVTDAFDDADTHESITVDLHPEHIEWLQEQAEASGLSLDHVLRSVLNAQMRNGADRVPADPERAADAATSSSDGDGESVVESLRTANQRLQKLMQRRRSREDAGDEDTRQKLARLRERLERGPSGDGASDSSPPVLHADDADDDTRSMFDMMGDE